MTHPSGPYGYGYAPAPPSRPGVIPLAPLGLGDVLAGAFDAYRRYGKVLLGVALASYAVAGALIVAVGLAAWAALADRYERWADAPARDGAVPDLTALFVGVGAVWLACAVGLLFATALLYAAVAVVVQEAVVGRAIGFGAVWRRAWSRVGATLGSLVLTALAALVPMLLFLVGLCLMLAALLVSIASERELTGDGTGLAVAGLLVLLLSTATLPVAVWIWVKFSLAPAAAVIESAGPLTAMRRSAELVRGSWWRILGYTLVMVLIVSAVSFTVQMGASLVTQFSLFAVPDDGAPGTAFAAVGGLIAAVGLVQLLVQALLAPLQPLVSALLYVDQRIRRENLAPALAAEAAV